MATTYDPITGLLEVPIPAIRKSEYLPSKLHITRFFGGTERGVSIQLGIEDENGYKDIQLDNRSANELLDLLQDTLRHISIDEKI